MTQRRQLPGLLLALAGGVPILGAGPAGAQGSGPAPAAPLVVEKRTFEAGEYRSRGGGVIANMRVGYETAGALNAAGDNAVLISHFFSGNGHAFGQYEAGGAPGWWDAVVGPGKPIDTNRFFVVANDTPVNLNARDPRTVTTGPASVNPATGRPWALEFPVLSMRDFVEVQKRLLDSLGVKRLALVAGPSMGALQSIEWAAAYPEMVERVMPAVATGSFDAFLQAWMEVWEAPIRLDPNWRNGDYYAQGREPPLRGLAEALKIVTLQARDRGSLAQFDRAVPAGQDPAKRIGDSFAVEKFLDEAAMARAKTSDANAFLYLTRANQLFLNEYPGTEAALSRSQARWLVLPSVGDRVFPLEYNVELTETLKKLGRPVRMVELRGTLGHLEGVANVMQAEAAIRDFLGT
ncbi:homoserine O-acetyltransferase [Roseomonas sp. OT10]|uniref:E22 family MetX-like putative esterase n=1 Tax=Roseomonas cutis TaxID=2897332 RepID=UPI001E4A17BE|nr:homoserine O-acetyltransferase [Roseomonas sp. OT10]UFN49557.1 homoserine O-acetyltransferase [Roseomonas sp. OT10]